ARVVEPQLQVAVRQFDKRIVLAHGDSFSGRSDARHRTGEQPTGAAAGSSSTLADRVGSLRRSATAAAAPTRFIGERQSDFNLRVLRKRFRAGHVYGAAGAIDSIRTGA